MRKFRNTRGHRVEQFKLALNRTNFSFLTQIQNIDEAIQALTAVLRNLLDIIYQWKFFRISSRYPKHMTALLKTLPAKRHWFIKKHHYRNAEDINMHIRESISTQLRQNDYKKGSRHFWDRVNELAGKAKTTSSTIDISFNGLNNFFANISHTDS